MQRTDSNSSFSKKKAFNRSSVLYIYLVKAVCSLSRKHTWERSLVAVLVHHKPTSPIPLKLPSEFTKPPGRATKPKSSVPLPEPPLRLFKSHPLLAFNFPHHVPALVVVAVILIAVVALRKQ